MQFVAYCGHISADKPGKGSCRVRIERSTLFVCRFHAPFDNIRQRQLIKLHRTPFGTETLYQTVFRIRRTFYIDEQNRTLGNFFNIVRKSRVIESRCQSVADNKPPVAEQRQRFAGLHKRIRSRFIQNAHVKSSEILGNQLFGSFQCACLNKLLFPLQKVCAAKTVRSNQFKKIIVVHNVIILKTKEHVNSSRQNTASPALF